MCKMKDTLAGRMTLNAWKKDTFSTISFFALIAISVMLFSLTVLLFANLSGAIDHLMRVAKTPDFLQMHTGVVDEDALEAFADGRNDIEDWQLCRFLNLENGMLYLGEMCLQDSTQDNGLCVQGDGFDWLLDMNNALPQVKEGEVYVPVCYQKEYGVAVGEWMAIGNERLKIAGFIRDSQMNSMMASSKRFLVCQSDYDRLFALGTEEYLIEYMLKENMDIGSFQTAYEDAGLPMNGPTITKPLIKMMNALSDGIMIMIVLLISILVLMISLVCIRFMLLTRIEMERTEIGVLKALGVSKDDIKGMFMRRYLPLVMSGVIVGLAFVFVAMQPLSVQTQRLYGSSEHVGVALILSVLGAALLAGLIFLFIRRLLRGSQKITALSALTGRDAAPKKKGSMLGISIVVGVSVFLMLVPANLYSSMSSSRFVTYMGIGDGEIRIDIRQTDNLKDKTDTVASSLAKDEAVETYAVYQTCLVPAILESGERMNMLVEMGNHTRFPVTYSEGRAPQQSLELALSYLLANEIGLGVGDTLSLAEGEKIVNYTVSGIYSDITNGGKTAKLYQKNLDTDKEVMWSIAYVTLREDTNAKLWMQGYQTEGVTAVDIKAYVRETYGQTISQIGTVSILVRMVASVVMILVIALFLRFIIQKNRNQISIQKALGFTGRDIQMEYAARCIRFIVGGILAGILLGSFAGEKLCGMVLHSFGADGFRFVYNPVEIIVLLPMIAGIAGCLAIMLGTREIKKVGAVECCRGKE